MKEKKKTDLTLFGSDDNPWISKDWTDSDDRVRGGKSQSYLECSDDSARFHGNLDIETLGGAGFASQRTTGDDRSWDLSDYVGIQLNISKEKRYTFILKDELLPPKKEDGREQATISYECDFELPPQDEPDDTKDKSIFIPWKSFTPTYRGKVKKDADPLETKDIKRMSIMMRRLSFFGTQKGDFSLTISSIKALVKVPGSSEEMVVKQDMWQVEQGAMPATDDPRYIRIHEDFYVFQINVRVHRKTALVLGLISVALLVFNLCV
ncbi:hypothetical protein AMS68_006925 [Peltaster fructicola]|uniref:NADH:ubiquinone oxidoreductase intermediate-associated protein 30 domain-containing protein n=1 Tax=Peltaster fructicola TaxID=286661 RepID=A0A6H0Y3I7_9PEZI|nr:hypothetical protein AMS68_006925 [Peltaster fructicola]